MRQDLPGWIILASLWVPMTLAVSHLSPESSLPAAAAAGFIAALALCLPAAALAGAIFRLLKP